MRMSSSSRCMIECPSFSHHRITTVGARTRNPERPPIDLLRPFPAIGMKAWKVSSAVGNTKNDSPELRLPVDSGPADLFSGARSDETIRVEWLSDFGDLPGYSELGVGEGRSDSKE